MKASVEAVAMLRKGLCGHRRGYDRRVDAGTVTMAASIFEPHILQNLAFTSI